MSILPREIIKVKPPSPGRLLSKTAGSSNSFCGTMQRRQMYLTLADSLVSIAIRWAQWDIAQMLLEQTDIDVDTQNHSGRIALSLAAASASLAVMKHLVGRRNAKISLPDNTGRLAIDWARHSEHTESLFILHK